MLLKRRELSLAIASIAAVTTLKIPNAHAAS
jgi:hypothetical protein